MRKLLLCGVFISSLSGWAYAGHPGLDTSAPNYLEIHHWLSHQYSKATMNNCRGRYCCDASDGYLLENEQWGIADDQIHYKVLIEDQWYIITDDQLVDPFSSEKCNEDDIGGPNPTGKAVVWYKMNDDYSGIELEQITPPQGLPHTPTIYCFAPGTRF